MKKIFLIFTAFSPLFLHGQGFQVNLQGQKQQAMGSAGSAFVQDAAILFYNPGGTPFLKKNGLVVGVTPTIPKGKFLDENTNVTNVTTSPVSYPFTAYGTFGLKKNENLRFGMAVYTPFGSTVEWENGWTGRFALTRLQLQSIFFQPTISYKVNERLGIGAGFVFSHGKVNLQKDLPVMDNEGKYGHAELAGTANGYGFNAGLYYEASEKLSIGLSFRSRVDMKVKSGQATFNVPNALAANFPNGSFAANLPLPRVITIGLAYKFSDEFTLAVDVNHVGWVAYDTLAFDYQINTPTLQDTKSPRNYKNTFSVRVGGQYNITENLIARLGISYGETPVGNGYVTPETPDANRLSYAGGITYKIGEHFGIDASMLFTSLTRKDTNLETGLSGTFKTNVCAPGIAVTYNF